MMSYDKGLTIFLKSNFGNVPPMLTSVKYQAIEVFFEKSDENMDIRKSNSREGSLMEHRNSQESNLIVHAVSYANITRRRIVPN